ncbi:hypothetical protein TNCV_543121 [Trichonephila clavipes]|nr:hypothetical protein TNCV_543121 [Trichonephila clavipes]
MGAVQCSGNDITDSQGIEMERANTYSPEMNGVSERFNSTALDPIRAMLRSSGLSNKFCGKDKYSGPVPKGESSTSEYNNHEAHHVEVVIPRNFKEASLSPDKDK